jgi:serine/threonine protein kinase
MADHVGQQLGNYQLICLLGQGGFADVYLGEHIYLNTLTAIKLLQTHLVNDDFEAFLNEARTIASLTHPHIVRVLDFGIERDTPFLVMEYAPNGTLRQHHPKGVPLPLDTIVSYVGQVASALQYAHDRKLIHRDVKPENMLLGPNGTILLSDFGLVLTAQSSRQQNTQDAIGTLAYMSPEQLEGKPRPASDQYSLGVIVYEWLTGDRPFQGNFTEVASQHMLVAPPSLREKLPTISPEIERVVLTALAKDPHQRFADVQTFALALEQACRPLLSPQTRVSLLNHSTQSPAVAGSQGQRSQFAFLTSPTNKLAISIPDQGSPPKPGASSPDQFPVAMPNQSLLTPVLTPNQPIENKLDQSSLPTLSPGNDALVTLNISSLPTSVTPLPEQPSVEVPNRATHPSATVNSFGQYPSPSSVAGTNPLVKPPLNQPEGDEGGISRRMLIMSLAGLAGLALAGGGVALLVQGPHTPVTSINPTSNPTLPPTPNLTQPPITPQATSTPAIKHERTATPKPTPSPTPTSNPTPTPSPTPTPKPTPSPTPTPKPTPTPTPVPIISQGTGTLPATKSFNFDLGYEVSSGGDVLWNVQLTSRRLNPKGKAKLANMGVINFNSITAAKLKSLSYSTTPISSDKLATGDVFAVLTNGGNYAKVKVLAYGINLSIQWVTYKG